MNIKHPTARFALFNWLLCAALAGLPAVNADAASAISGQLACTTKAGEPHNEHGPLLLTCSFQQANGKTARFVGEIERSGLRAVTHLNLQNGSSYGPCMARRVLVQVT